MVEMTGASRHDVVVAGLRFALRRADPPAGGPGRPPVLLLHGVPETALMWRQLLPELASDRTVLAPDLKGFGGSEARGPYDIPTLVRELVALARSQVEGPVDVVGHDWGGTLGAVMAARQPDLVRRLVVANAPYQHVDYLRAWHMLLFSAPAVPKPLLQLGGRRAVRLMLRAGWRADTALEPEVAARYADAYAPPERLEAMLSYYRTTTRPRLVRAARRLAQPVLPVRAKSGAEGEQHVRVAPHPPEQPTLVIWGARDPVLPLSVGEAAVRDLGPRTDMTTVPDAGHFVVEEAPQTVLPAVRTFLDASNG